MVGHGVHDRRFGKLMPEKAHRIIAMIVGQDEDHTPGFGLGQGNRLDFRGHRHNGLKDRASGERQSKSEITFHTDQRGLTEGHDRFEQNTPEGWG